MSLPPWDQSISVVVGASTGFGSQLARELASRGSRLFLIARQTGPLEVFAQTLQRDFPRVSIETIAADATHIESLHDAARQIASRTDQIHLLINAVGKSDRGRLLDVTDDELNHLFRLNVLSAIHGVRAFHEALKKSKGTIVNIGSLSSKFAPRFLGGYSVTKFGLAAASQQLRLELAADGIHVMLACPGPIRRDDGATRYAELSDRRNLPESASAPGGGAKIKGLDPIWLAKQILDGAFRGYPEMMFPGKSRLLLALLALFPGWGESVLRKSTS
jgi:short-subunit dehydrogenase